MLLLSASILFLCKLLGSVVSRRRMELNFSGKTDGGVFAPPRALNDDDDDDATQI